MEEFKLRIAAIIRAEPEHIPLFRANDCEGWEFNGDFTQPVFNELARC